MFRAAIARTIPHAVIQRGLVGRTGGRAGSSVLIKPATQSIVPTGFIGARSMAIAINRDSRPPPPPEDDGGGTMKVVVGIFGLLGLYMVRAHSLS